MDGSSLAAALGAIALGGAVLLLWVASRRSRSVWERSVASFGALTSRSFAEGFAGGSALVGLGLVMEGLGVMVPRSVGVWLVLAIVPLTLAGLAVSLVKKPRVLFPPHTRDAASRR